MQLLRCPKLVCWAIKKQTFTIGLTNVPWHVFNDTTWTNLSGPGWTLITLPSGHLQGGKRPKQCLQWLSFFFDVSTCWSGVDYWCICCAISSRYFPPELDTGTNLFVASLVGLWYLDDQVRPLMVYLSGSDQESTEQTHLCCLRQQMPQVVLNSNKLWLG